MSDNEYEQSGADGADEFPMQASALRKNGHVTIKGHPCKIVEMSTSKTGKHGHAKVHFVALDIFTDKKLEDLCPSTHNMNVPIVVRKEYTVISYDDKDNSVSLMDDNGETREDLEFAESILPENYRTLKKDKENQSGWEKGFKVDDYLEYLSDNGQRLVVTVVKALKQEIIKKVEEKVDTK